MHLTFEQITSYLGQAVLLASIVSSFVPKTSTLGRWLAWFATCPLTHLPAAGKPTERTEPKQEKES